MPSKYVYGISRFLQHRSNQLCSEGSAAPHSCHSGQCSFTSWCFIGYKMQDSFTYSTSCLFLYTDSYCIIFYHVALVTAVPWLLYPLGVSWTKKVENKNYSSQGISNHAQMKLLQIGLFTLLLFSCTFCVLLSTHPYPKLYLKSLSVIFFIMFQGFSNTGNGKAPGIHFN